MSITGLSPQREQQWQERQSLRIARQYEATLAREIRRAMRQLAKHPNSPGKQAEIVADHGQNIKRIITKNWRQAWSVFGERMLNATQKSMRGMETKQDEESELFHLYLQQFIVQYGSQKVTQITGTTKKQAMEIINDTVAEGARDGLGQAALGKLIRERMKSASDALSTRRGRLIARTETHNAQASANHSAAKASGVPMVKEWVASRGERTRDWHSDADEQTVPIDQPFIVDGEEMQHPGDPSASARNVINCRCVVAYSRKR